MGSEGCVQTHGGIGIEQSEAVGSDHTHAVAACSLDESLLQLSAFRADLGKAGSDDDDGFHTSRRTIIDCAEDGVWPNRDDGQIRVFRQSSHRRITRQRRRPPKRLD